MIDLHCHILPGVDDGSDSPDTSCRMAAQAARSGVSRIVATPHRGSDPARERGRAEGFRRALRRLQDELDRWSIPIRLLPGSEVLLSGRTDRRFTLPNSCVSAALYNRRIYAFAHDMIYRADANAQRFTAVALPGTVGDAMITGYLGMLKNGVALLASDNEVYAVTLP